jgi:hypothetical protein
MADFTVTPANVIASAGAATSQGTTGTGVTITAGQTLARQNDGTIVLYDANGVAPLNTMVGVALHASLAGQPIVYARSDPTFTPGFTLPAIGDAVIGSQNPGMLCPDADKLAGWYVTEVGRAISTTQI